MLLCINANNTNVKFAVYDGEKPVGDWRLKTEAGRTADQYVVWLNQLMIMAGLDFKKITGAIIASVVPQSVFHLTMLCEQHLKTKPLVVGDPAVKLGIQVKMDIPVSTVGADRLANAVGGHITYKRPLIIVDFGTATTFDVADGAGNYLGGAISPGINLSVEILHSATAMLPPHRRRAARAGDRQKHHRGHAIRHLLGLCRVGGGYGAADHIGVRRRSHGDRHRRPRPAFRRRHAAHSPFGSGDHDARPRRDLPA